MFLGFITFASNVRSERVALSNKKNDTPQILFFVRDPAQHDRPTPPKIIGTCLAFESPGSAIVFCVSLLLQFKNPFDYT